MRTPRAAWLVWGIGLLAYVIAVFNRSSLGVAGLEAADRFGIPASTLSIFAVLQLLVYAAMQLPVGMLLDRFGTRLMVVGGLLLMTGGQLLFATTDRLGVALVARVLIGAGDAMIFVSVLRLVILWFPVRHSPLIQQLTGMIGQAGAIVAAVPLVGLLDLAGWTSTFAGAGALGAFVAVLVIALVKDAPPHIELPPPAGFATVRRNAATAWRTPGTRLGLWTHFVTQFSGTTFLLLWGYPFLVEGEGLAPATAGSLLTVLTLSSMVVGPALARLVVRHPFHRSGLVLGIVAVTAAMWTVVLSWPGRTPVPVLIALMLVLATNGPGSMIAFDFARTLNPPNRLGSATGIANIGGFTASLITVLAIGAVLDALTPAGADHSMGAFRTAFAVQYAVWAFGAVMVWRYRRRTRRTMATERPEAFAALRAGEVIPLPA